jgi:hypothetical protein
MQKRFSILLRDIRIEAVAILFLHLLNPGVKQLAWAGGKIIFFAENAVLTPRQRRFLHCY